MDLEKSVTSLAFVGPIYAKRLEKLGITTILDLLYHIPSRFLDFRESAAISSLREGDIVNIEGVITSFKNQYTKLGKKLQMVGVKDKSGDITVVWFNQPYLARILREGERVSFSGKVDWYGRKLALVSPEYEVLKDGLTPIHTKGLVPIYPETAGISSKWLRRRILDTLTRFVIPEYLPEFIRKKYNLVDHRRAITATHLPKNPQEFDEGRKRLAFNELLFLHLGNLKHKSSWQKNKVKKILKIQKEKIDAFINSLPFELTSSQKRAVGEILKDLGKEVPMNRLLEGDVGSGKTVVAAIGAFVGFLNGSQTVFMAPTQILANQHVVTLKRLFKGFKIRISLVTSERKKTDFQKADIYVGTHALIHRNIDMRDVSLVVIDEQHRFGVEQRQHLVNKIGSKHYAPHILTMTATPIPRTIALTLYGDLLLSTLDELPKGRQLITTWVVPPQKRQGAYKWIEDQIEKEKIQVFVICPLIDESEKLGEVKAVTTEVDQLKKFFPRRRIGILHGRQSQKIKAETLKKFKDGKIDILVATPIVEVGIDIPNAAIIVIEGADRFGLAQLHQLRGRIGRGAKKSYCLAFSENRSKKVFTRLSALKKALSGFELAELDLRLRGPGEIFGFRQSGFSEFKVATWGDTKLIRETKEVAEEVLANPTKYRLLTEILDKKEIAPN